MKSIFFIVAMLGLQCTIQKVPIYYIYIDKNVHKHRFSIKSFVQIYVVTFIEQGTVTIGNTRVSVAYYFFYDNIQLYEPLGKGRKALLFTFIS